ncbi:MAG: 2-C-methyl-D-erythritol 4-phosphate cytidylyltransferase [Selenomonadaceae bacterium]|uniref:2-C-methyl-D-erythritol 4-phosphate cytidylyltransferase n=1 Tax=Anaerovibrio slackiae TaxID=2652309 RepID=UPI0023F40DD1|nr:2-C-methyl-D-erythritol 4-phosphate cytidylyltransferase [Anaerovibrio slackiae]MBQ2009185.1 2-C-methyl-D-erythritol 4-phosphate cytidylyltransferase [Selenomonadaceae bacterium]MBQ2411266.1 2-C-methyl-D-erythritol 4-phosphate cytidylyltransferase [Selenomonadaceae bacterium]MBQ5651869.1 2-C-methyl-D-erythritol 4-phosphate cytidylyltransferase [Selenomonadaceae bacterium]MBQ5733358.1 2-C-methyl-D-erythritol 4-phosphate cytidylyltransferase [Selenomonadaceae bacterium]MBQ5846949.1 2-C-methyl
MVTAIFPAAGKGKRMQAGMNKVLVELEGVPILVRTLARFSRCQAVDRLVVVVAAHEVEFVTDMLTRADREYGLKPWLVTAGGSERQYSVWNGIQAVQGAADDDIILVHDAARPLVSEKTILETIRVAEAKGAAIAAVPAKNTIKLCNAAGEVVETPDRSRLWEVQTPQGFRRDILVRANQQAMAESFLGTDDASLVERLGQKVFIVESDYRNIKLTTPEDMVIAKAFLAAEEENE